MYLKRGPSAPARQISPIFIDYLTKIIRHNMIDFSRPVLLSHSPIGQPRTWTIHSDVGTFCS